ncbi:MAG TPA: tetratricopeptide repeat protein [Terriglobales bacterium]|nr:tetratricopeptide repeat protein [Terriglobales bacterium]
MRSWFRFAGFCVAAAISQATLASLAFAQDFEIKPNQQSSQKASPGASKSETQQGLGWGSSIEIARQARAAQDALNRGDYNAAMTYAQQAANAAPQNTQLWWLLGYSARLAGHLQASVDAYDRGLKNQPNSAAGLSGLAQTYVKMGRTSEAEKLLTGLVESNPKDPNNLAMLGELLLESDPNKGLEYLRRSEGAQPSPRTELLIARAYQRLNQPAEAQKYLERAKSRAPHDPEVLRAVADEYRDSGQFDLAIKTLQAIPSKTTDVLADLAYTYDVAGRKQEAAELYAELAKKAQGNIGYNLSAAQAYYDIGQIDQTRAFLDRARQLDANHYRLHAILAQIAVSEGRSPDAINEYETALKSLPETVPEGPLYPAELRLNLYELYVQAGDQAAARQQLQLASNSLKDAQVPGNSKPEFLRLRAAVESASGDTEAANRDLQEALSLAPKNVNSMVNYASLLWKIGQKDPARDMFKKALAIDPKNRQALISMGFLARDMQDPKAAGHYFNEAVRCHPNDFAPHLALGDLATSEGDFKAAQTHYQEAYRLMPTNPLIIAGGANAALESHNLDLAKTWLDRAHGAVNNNVHVMRERERYLTWKGQYQQAADLGAKVLEQLPNDTEGAVYRAYDLYYLGQYQEALDLATKYEPILPDNRDLALITGYVQVRFGHLPEALKAFTLALKRDPQMATGYANRGYVLNDLRQPEKAVSDFQTALKLKPDYGEAHLGLAYSYLQLHRPTLAIDQLEKAKAQLGEPRPWHLGRAEAFRQERKFPQAEGEYKIALQEHADDVTTQLALADVQYRQRHFEDSIGTLNAALKLAPENPHIYVQRAQAEAHLGERDKVLQDVDAAQHYGKGDSEVLMASGDALLATGDRDAAMKYFSRALEDPGSNEVGIRLAIAEIFQREGHYDDAHREIGLAFAEARVSDTSEVTPEDLVQAANVLLAMHDFDLARTYYARAREAGADDGSVAIGLANAYLAQGDTHKADLELARLRGAGGYENNYDYLMAEATLYRERQDTVRALSTFAQASAVGGGDDRHISENAQYEVAGQEGRQITRNLSLFSDGSFSPVFEDINVYQLDARLLKVTNPALLPPPRSSFQSLGAEYYRVHLNGFPVISGFVGESITHGRLFFPSAGVVEDRNTFDTMFNAGLTPVLRFGTNSITFNPGVQFTLRRDTSSPLIINQNLFRQYLYLSTSSFFNWVSVHGSAIHESGPFTEQDLNSRDVSANIEFTVGRPWGNTSLLTGYSVRDLLFKPQAREYFSSSTYLGLQRKFGDRLTVAILGEYLRSWLVQFTDYSIAQALLPGARVEYRAGSHWNIQGSFILSRGEGFHAYDNAQSEFTVSYVHPMRRNLDSGTSESQVSYPSRFSFGVKQQTFYDFNGQSKTTVLPIVRFTLF